MLRQIGHLDQAFELRVDLLVASGKVSTSTSTTATSPVWARASGDSSPASSTAAASLVATGMFLVCGAGIVTAGVESVLSFALGGQLRLRMAPALASWRRLTSSPTSSSLASDMRIVTSPQVIVAAVGDATSV